MMAVREIQEAAARYKEFSQSFIDRGGTRIKHRSGRLRIVFWWNFSRSLNRVLSFESETQLPGSGLGARRLIGAPIDPAITTLERITPWGLPGQEGDRATAPRSGQAKIIGRRLARSKVKVGCQRSAKRGGFVILNDSVTGRWSARCGEGSSKLGRFHPSPRSQNQGLLIDEVLTLIPLGFRFQIAEPSGQAQAKPPRFCR